jgi:hypothetical protein
MLAGYKVCVCALTLWCAGIAGCSSAPSADFSTSPDESPSRAKLRGDWDDLEAAVLVAAGKAEMAVLMVGTSGPSEFRAELTTTTDETAKLTVIRGADDPDRLDAACRVGHFGDAEVERRLIGHLSRRLAQLHGREWAPVR